MANANDIGRLNSSSISSKSNIVGIGVSGVIIVDGDVGDDGEMVTIGIGFCRYNTDDDDDDDAIIGFVVDCRFGCDISGGGNIVTRPVFESIKNGGCRWILFNVSIIACWNFVERVALRPICRTDLNERS